MRLRRLEIQGFKSFPDKMTLSFNYPITAVVGPNGSGKSNIADAVRWVLGEQSTKTLRGGKMEDVIFSGTPGRKPVGYSHVQLVIDNSGGALPEQGQEITVTRRLYRSGESEYRLNGVMVRLKDIHELFMDTGLGRDGYSIIGQGKIAEIVSSKSQSRREIFEEAAGISKFRYRKEEAQRKLAQAEENLVRLRDIIGELEERVEPLREQSEKAAEFLRLSEEKKTLEISLWMGSIAGLREQAAAQDDKIYLCKNEYETLEGEGEKRALEIEASYSLMQSLSAESEEKRAAIKALEAQVGAADSEIAVFYNDIRHNEQSIMQLDADQKAAELGADEVARQQAEKENALAHQREELDVLRAKVDASAEKLDEQRIQVQKVSGELNALRTRRDAVQEAIREAQIQKASSASVLQESLARLEALRGSSSAQDSAVAELAGSIAECEVQIREQEEEIAALENANRGYQLKRQSRQKALEDIDGEIKNATDSAQDAGRRARMLEDLEKNMEGFAGSVKYILDASRQGSIKGVIGPVSSLIATEERYSLAIETALGPAMQNVVVEDEAAAMRAIRMLKDSKTGRATFLPLTTVKGGKTPDLSSVRNAPGYLGLAVDLVKAEDRLGGIIRQLLGRVCVAEDLDSANRIAKASGYTLRIVTLDGQVINAGGSFTGGSSAKGVGILGRRREIERLLEKQKSLEGEAAALEPRRKAAVEELSALDASIGGTQAEIKTAQEEAVRLRATADQLHKSLETAKTNRELAKKEVESLSARLEGLKEGELSAEKLMEELASQRDELEERIHATRERRDALTIGAETASAALGDLRLMLLAAQKDLQGAEQELARFREALETAGERKLELAVRKEALQAGIGQTRARIEEISEGKGRWESEKAALVESISELTAKRNEIEEVITAMHTADKELSARREAVARELATLESKKASLQQEYDIIIGKLWDEYELTRSEAVKLAVELPSRDKAQRRLSELRGGIRGLGTVNLASIEEYKQVSERYEFLTGQIADAENAKATLTKLIGGLTEEMRAMFSENFAKISHYFSKIFVQLFGGGRAELTLTEGDDVLESGVEIYVQPPGKIIKHLSLLSGGEQAFVAIAIYFAILRVRPSPFCVLDEIEAALDDVNVQRFATYLRRMSEKTQFIAITHRRGTMEEADMLYGVTMQDEGVSKLLELKVHEVEEQLGIS